METTKQHKDREGDLSEELMLAEELMGAAQDPTDKILAFNRAHASWKVGRRCLDEFDQDDSEPTYPIL